MINKMITATAMRKREEEKSGVRVNLDKGELTIMTKSEEVLDSKEVVNESGDEIMNNRDVVKPKEITNCNTLLKGEAREKYDNSQYISKDLSWIEFNKRIIDMSKSDKLPVMDRLRFLAISASNLDEFNSVRYGNLLNKIEKDPEDIRYGLSVTNEEKVVNCSMKSMRKDQLKVYDDIKIQMQKAGVRIFDNSIKLDATTKKLNTIISNAFEAYIYPAMTPIVFDESRPFPFIKHGTINIGVILEDEQTGQRLIGTMQVPDVGFRYLEIKDGEHGVLLISVEDLILRNLRKLFINKKIVTSCIYRLLRNSDVEVVKTKNHDKFLTEEMFDTLKIRDIGEPIYLEITDTKKELHKVITKALNIKKKHVFKTHYVDLTSSANIKANKIDMAVLSGPKFEPQVGEQFIGESNVFDLLDREDVILHHPYESFDHITKMIEQAAVDPNVISIKQTLYRVSKNSPIVRALIKAAKLGKHVTCLLEVKARFNEAENLKWAEELEASGSHVIYGVDNLKTHCKMSMIVRNSKKGLKRYCHLSTGNYNEVTGKIYTDISYFTSNSKICDDVTKLFNVLTGYSEPRLKRLISAPHNMRNDLNTLIDKEIEAAKEGKDCGIDIKCNSLDDIHIINKLYEASMAGVKINLIVRGICCLRTRQPYSENIRVISIVGKFLEHSRIYNFKASGEAYIGSADLMQRNLDRRFEILTPIVNKECRQRVLGILNTFVNDDTCYELVDRKYMKLTGAVSSQDIFMNKAKEVNIYNNINKIYIRQRK